MSVQALVIVNSENRPVVVRSRWPESETSTVSALFHLHSSLDIIEEKQANRDPFIGLLTQSESHKIFGFASTTNTKILFMVSPQAIRDNEARLILKTVHNAYVNVTTGNPFYRFGHPIKSSILNKITPEKFKKLSKELLSVGLDSPAILKGVILLIFDKALEEPKYSSMYAQLCRIISEEAPNFETGRDSGTGNLNRTFCRLLLAKCQDEFENRRRANEAFENRDSPLTALEEEQRSVAKHKMLGNIKFICELGKQNLLQESILHLCIQQLLSKQKKDQSIQEKAEDLECLCQIMKTVGRLLDNERAKALMNQYFERMEYYSNHCELNSRIRFMLQDVLELRRNNVCIITIRLIINLLLQWSPRRVQREAGPQTILQIREEAAKDYGVYLPPHQYTFGPLTHRSGVAHSKSGRMDEMFSQSPLMQLGTGPGAINDFHNPGFTNRRNQAGGHHNFVYPFQVKREQSNRQGLQIPISNSQSANSGGGSGGGRELPPRFQKLHQQQQQPVVANSVNVNQVVVSDTSAKPLASLANQNFDTSGISLRPAMNSMVSNPNIPLNQLSMTNTTLNIKNNNINNSKTLENNIISDNNKQIRTIKNINESIKGQVVTNQSNIEAILAKTQEAVDEFLSVDQNIDEIVIKFKEMKIPKNYQRDVLVNILKKSLQSSESERESSNRLLNHLRTEDVIGVNIFLNAIKDLINEIEDLERDLPRVKSNVAAFMSNAIGNEVMSLKEASEPLEGGQHYPLFLLCLQHLHKSKGNDWLFDAFTESKINLIEMLPENDRNKERMADILEDRGLSFLYPMLRIESDLWKQLTQADCTPTSLYRWLKDNVDPSLQNNTDFIRVLFTCLLKYIGLEMSKLSISDSTATRQTQTNGTNIIDNEKELLTKYQSVLKAFLHEKPSLQLMALYALQSFCFTLNFPKGMLLRWFLMLYDLEVIEEDVFIRWKEDINDEFPGKGKALFQVNQWLTWLQEADEEETDSEGEPLAN